MEPSPKVCLGVDLESSSKVCREQSELWKFVLVAVGGVSAWIYERESASSTILGVPLDL